MAIHTVGQQHANVSQQSSAAETKPVVRRDENCEPIIFDLREQDDEVEDQGIRLFTSTGDDDDDDEHEPEMEDCRVIDFGHPQWDTVPVSILQHGLCAKLQASFPMICHTQRNNVTSVPLSIMMATSSLMDVTFFSRRM